jgi:hypothetical protein
MRKMEADLEISKLRIQADIRQAEAERVVLLKAAMIQQLCSATTHAQSWEKAEADQLVFRVDLFEGAEKACVDNRKRRAETEAAASSIQGSVGGEPKRPRNPSPLSVEELFNVLADFIAEGKKVKKEAALQRLMMTMLRKFLQGYEDERQISDTSTLPFLKGRKPDAALVRESDLLTALTVQAVIELKLTLRKRAKQKNAGS